jgi:hypothetical protein
LKKDNARKNSKKIQTLGLHPIKHGHAQGGLSPEYNSWRAMIERCTNSKVQNFAYYGGRGITVCPRWLHSFKDFLTDMGHKPSLEHTIERKRVDGNYEPLNCCWATKKEQAQNRRKPKAFRQIAHLERVSGLTIEQLIQKYEGVAS